MIFAIDENETAVLGEALSLILPGDEFVHVRSLDLGGAGDVELYSQLAGRGVGALITRDVNQLADPAERTAIHSSGLHWVGHKEPRGSGGAMIGRLLARYSVAMPYISQAISELTEPCAFRVKGHTDDFNSSLRVEAVGRRHRYSFDRDGNLLGT